MSGGPTIVALQKPTPIVIALPPTRPMQIAGLSGQGPKGISAFQDWQILNPGGSWDEFLASLGTGSSTAMIEFTFADVPERLMFTLPQAAFIDRLQLIIEQAYNGDAPTLAARTNTGIYLMSSDQNDPTFAASYESAPQAQLPAGTQIFLENQPGFGATAGKGRLMFDLH